MGDDDTPAAAESPHSPPRSPGSSCPRAGAITAVAAAAITSRPVPIGLDPDMRPVDDTVDTVVGLPVDMCATRSRLWLNSGVLRLLGRAIDGGGQ